VTSFKRWKRRNPPPRLEFRPPEPEVIMERVESEVSEHFPGHHESPFTMNQIEDFINYVDAAFKSVPPELFEYKQATIDLSGPVEMPGVFQFTNKIDCWWMKDPVALCVEYRWREPGRDSGVEFASIGVRSWQAFIASAWRGMDETAASAPYGLQMAAVEVPWPFSPTDEDTFVKEEARKRYWTILSESVQLIDEFESTGQWKVSSTGIPLRLPRIFPMQKILFNAEWHPGQVGNVRDMGLTSLSIDKWGRGYGLNDEPPHHLDPEVEDEE